MTRVKAQPIYGGLVHIVVGTLAKWNDAWSALTYCHNTAVIDGVHDYQNAFHADIVDVSPTCLRCVANYRRSR